MCYWGSIGVPAVKQWWTQFLAFTGEGKFDMGKSEKCLIKFWRNLFHRIEVDYRELKDKEKWEIIARAFKC